LQFGDDGCKVLATHIEAHHEGLTKIEIPDNAIGAGVVDLAAALAQLAKGNGDDHPPVTSIKELVLASNKIGADGCAGLAEHLPSTTIGKLDLSSNELTDADVTALFAALSKTQLRAINLSHNQLSDGAPCQADRCVGRISLEFLGMIEAAAVAIEALAAALPESAQVQHLFLHSNPFTAKGATALAEAIPKSNLVGLSLWDVQIGPDGKKALVPCLNSSSLRTLQLTKPRFWSME
jgi:Ran GTPase-activating protein (RanGAP) involved in mRNA processing and transport